MTTKIGNKYYFEKTATVDPFMTMSKNYEGLDQLEVQNACTGPNSFLSSNLSLVY